MENEKTPQEKADNIINEIFKDENLGLCRELLENYFIKEDKKHCNITTCIFYDDCYSKGFKNCDERKETEGDKF